MSDILFCGNCASLSSGRNGGEIDYERFQLRRRSFLEFGRQRDLRCGQYGQSRQPTLCFGEYQSRDPISHQRQLTNPDLLALPPQHELDPDVDLLTAVNRRKLRIANLAIPVIASASSQPDDPLVLEIITETTNVLAGEIAHIVKIAEKKGLAPVSNATLSVVGGLISQPIYMDAVKQALSRVGVVFGDVQLVQDAAGEGAAALAIPHK